MRTTNQILLATILVLTLGGCAGQNHEYNPLGDATVTDITDTSAEAQDKHMIVIQAEIKRIVNAQGISNTSLYWVLNGTRTKDNRAVYDVTINVQKIRKRFIFGLTDGVIKMVREIPVEAEVNCQHEGDQYEGRDQA